MNGLLEALWLALRSIARSGLRSTLTMLGVLIGVAAVVVVVALGQSAREVLNVTLMAQKWARILVGAMQLGGANYLSEESVRAIDGRSDEEYRRKMLSR